MFFAENKIGETILARKLERTFNKLSKKLRLVI